MRTIRLLLIPTTAAWFLGALWWFGHKASSNARGPIGVAAMPQAVPVIHLGPAGPSEPAVENATSITADPDFQRVLVIPFVKNKGELMLDEAGGSWCAVVRDHLNAHPEAFVRVTGHTDADGDPALNMQLSIQRAEIVKAQLIERGLPAHRVTAEGMGAYEPVADNTTSKGKAMNRRVEIRVLP